MLNTPKRYAGFTLLAAMLLTACGATPPAPTPPAHAAIKLADCTGGPHCVSSAASDPDRYEAPIPYTGSREAARAKLVAVIQQLPRSQVVKRDPDYVSATFTSSIFRFVDDVEFVFPAAKPVIEVRSSSRIGYYDFNVNRNRVETIRQKFLEGKS